LTSQNGEGKNLLGKALGNARKVLEDRKTMGFKELSFDVNGGNEKNTFNDISEQEFLNGIGLVPGFLHGSIEEWLYAKRFDFSTLMSLEAEQASVAYEAKRVKGFPDVVEELLQSVFDVTKAVAKESGSDDYENNNFMVDISDRDDKIVVEVAQGAYGTFKQEFSKVDIALGKVTADDFVVVSYPSGQVVDYSESTMNLYKKYGECMLKLKTIINLASKIVDKAPVGRISMHLIDDIFDENTSKKYVYMVGIGRKYDTPWEDGGGYVVDEYSVALVKAIDR
jgi:hypothetical protein